MNVTPADQAVSATRAEPGSFGQQIETVLLPYFDDDKQSHVQPLDSNSSTHRSMIITVLQTMSRGSREEEIQEKNTQPWRRSTT